MTTTTAELNRYCIHCLRHDTVYPGSSGIYGSSADFCTHCEGPWTSRSVACEHCGTMDAWLDMECEMATPERWATYCTKTGRYD
jgi:hypothetical protein